MLWLSLLSACTSDSKPEDDSGPTDSGANDTGARCDAGPDVGTSEVFAAGFEAGTEGITFVDGRLFVASPTGVVELDTDGGAGAPTPLDHALGLAPAAGGVLVADPGVFTFDGSGEDGHLRLLPLPAGDPIDLAGGMPNPNFVTPTPWGEVLVSDDTGDTIYAVDPATGVVRDWLVGVPSPNGMAFSPDRGTLYVVTTFAPDPPLWAVPVDPAGAPGEPVMVTTFATGAAPDGMAVDADGGVWVALNLAGEVVRVDPATAEVTLVGSGLSTPASLAFGQGDGFDPCALYGTELYGSDVFRLAAGVSGVAVLPG